MEGSEEREGVPEEGGSAPSEGEYVAPRMGRGCVILGAVLLTAFGVYYLIRIWFFDLRELEEWLPPQVFPYLKLGASLFVALFGFLVLQSWFGELRTLTWDEQELEYSPVWGSARRFGWESVASFELPPTGLAKAFNKQDNAFLYLDLNGRRQIRVDPEADGYAALVQAMSAHHKIWDAARRSTEEETPEWDGVHAPNAGAYRAPSWLLPSRLAVVLVGALLSYHLLTYLLVAKGGRPTWYPSEYQEYAPFIAVFGALFLAAEGIRQCLTRTVRVVRWERDGFWLGWYSSTPRFHRWEELESVNQPSGAALGKTVIALTNGEKAVLHPSGRGYEALVAALERRTDRIG